MATRPARPAPVDATFPGLTAARLARAEAAWAALPADEQFRLLEEIVQVRGHELRRAYADLVGLGFGFPTRGVAAEGGERLVREPCVVFIVKRKLALTQSQHASRRLPRRLFAYAGTGAQRVLCAVPTDVKVQAAYGRAVPHGDDEIDAGDAAAADLRPFAIVVSGVDPDRVERGTVTACLRRASAPAARFALSCRHVLSRTSIDPPDAPASQPVHKATEDGPFLGLTDAARGAIDPEPAESFDAQLVRVAAADLPVLRATLAGLSFDAAAPALEGAAETPDTFLVATSRIDGTGGRRLVAATFVDYVFGHVIPYDQPEGGTLGVAHAQLLHARLDEGADALVRGDSGSAGVTAPNGGRLVGMYLGGDGTDAYFIPAWFLLDPENYGLPEADALAIVDP
jgi:hypothetical protein